MMLMSRQAAQLRTFLILVRPREVNNEVEETGTILFIVKCVFLRHFRAFSLVLILLFFAVPVASSTSIVMMQAFESTYKL